MRICMITSAPFPPYEGLGFYVWNLSRYLTENGHRVRIITRGSAKRVQRQTLSGITIERVPFVPTYPWHAHIHGYFVDKVVKMVEPETDLFHLHSPLVKFPRTTKPTFVTAHTTIRANAASMSPTNALGWMYKLQTPFSARLEQDLFRNADKLSAVAHSGVDDLGQYGVPSNKVTVLGNGVDTRVFSPGPSTHESARPYCLTVSRLGLRKGIEDLIQCAEQVTKQHPAYRFFIAGTGPLRDQLQNDIRKRGLTDKVRLLGQITDRSKLADLLRGAAIYVHPAHYEGLPAALLEAMACGCPIVATGVSGALDVIEHEKNGLLVPARNSGAMSRAVLGLITDTELKTELGNAAHKTIKEKYSWQAVSSNFVREYKNLL